MFYDCEYVTGGTSRAQLLEEQIALLEARIKELEHSPEANSPTTVFLAQPYGSNEDEPSTENDLVSPHSRFEEFYHLYHAFRNLLSPLSYIPRCQYVPRKLS